MAWSELTGGFERRRRRADYRAAFSGPAGRRTLADLYRFCGMASSSFVPGRPDETAFNEGRRRVFLRIAALLELDEDSIRRMIAPDHDTDPNS